MYFREENDMNLSTVIVLVVILLLLIPAIRYIYKHGTCGACPDAPTCSGHCHKDFLERLMAEPDYKDKEKKAEEIIKKHGV